MVPALAVADALRAEGAEVEFIGGSRAEAQLVPAAGFELHAIGVEGLSRTNPLRAARALARAALATVRARAILARRAPDAVLGAGGYVAGPVALAAVTLRIPLVLSEADSRLGLANRMMAPFARCVCLAFPPLSRDHLGTRGRRALIPRRAAARAARASRRYRVTGRPVLAPSADRAGARERFGIGTEETCVVVFGGSLGARSLNTAALEAFADAPFHVLHVSGRRDYDELASSDLRPSYELLAYLDLADFSRALAASDLAVARAGGSIFELSAHGLPAILVPYPHAAGDHQSANARWMSDAGAAITIADDELTGAVLARAVEELLADRARLAAMAAAARRLARPTAAADVAAELLEAARA